MDFPGKKSVSTAQVKHMIKHRSMGRLYIYLPVCMVNFCMVKRLNIGKYTRQPWMRNDWDPITVP